MNRLDAVGVPHAPLQTLDQVAAHPQTRALGMIETGPDGTLPLTGMPLSFDGERPASGWTTPRLGEHNIALLQRTG